MTICKFFEKIKDKRSVFAISVFFIIAYTQPTYAQKKTCAW